jgi:hypothetical protein
MISDEEYQSRRVVEKLTDLVSKSIMAPKLWPDHAHYNGFTIREFKALLKALGAATCGDSQQDRVRSPIEATDLAEAVQEWAERGEVPTPVLNSLRAWESAEAKRVADAFVRLRKSP